MRGLSYSEIHEALRIAKVDELAKLIISVARNVTLEPIEPYLRHLALISGFNAEVRFGRFDNILQEAGDADSDLWQASPDAILIFSNLEVLSPGLASQFSCLNSSEIESEVERVHSYLETTLAALRVHSQAMVLWHSFELPTDPALGIYDSQIDDGQTAVIHGLNGKLKQSLAKAKNAYYVDLNLCVARLGASKFYDLRYWHIARAPYSRDALQTIAAEDWKFIRAGKGLSKKCLVLDCDNVLWGGIIGEDGPTGIKLSQDYPGSIYYEFQREALSLYNRGVILALCSKNNEEDVWQVFRENPDMVLKEEHIAAARINWDDKVTNLGRLAEELNIGLDSMVLVDDSDFEAEQVRQLLPDVEVLHLPPEHAVENRNILRACGWFDTLTQSEEDRHRGTMYKAEAARRKLKATVDPATYLQSLEMKVAIRLVDVVSVPRVAQLTQRTNQFNLTTRRYSEADISGLTEDPNSEVLYLRLKDRLGDYGIVGAAVLTRHDRCMEIDTFLMSCRVIGRGVEDALLGSCFELAKLRGASMIRAKYIRTIKNGLVANFYAQRGFEIEYDASDQTIYSFDLTNAAFAVPDYLSVVSFDDMESDL